MPLLYIVRFLHQTTTVAVYHYVYKGCISSVSYIKPQQVHRAYQRIWVVYRPFPTSNHNQPKNTSYYVQLYIVRFLHQTTTNYLTYGEGNVLYIVRFLHQTTTVLARVSAGPLLYIVRFLHQTTTFFSFGR